MRRQVEAAIRKYGLLHPGGQVLAAVSGGADSVCLLYVLAQIREDWDLELKAVHVHHGLRGEEADRDAAFTKALCEKLLVPCSIDYVDVHRFSEEKGLSQEEAARELRYQALEAAAEGGNITGLLCLPMSECQLERSIQRAELERLLSGSSSLSWKERHG